MRDSTLKRTTNVAEVFPNRTHLHASTFSWAELQQLNAGDWFLAVRPSTHTCWHLKQTHTTRHLREFEASSIAVHLSRRQLAEHVDLKGFPVLQRDPFGTVSSLSEQDCSRAHNQSVPSLAQLLEIASRSGSLVLFDLHKPPRGHPYSHSYINVTLEVVRAHISSSQVSVQCKKR